jgi:NADH-quinone oxidoreductase subunit L
MNTVATGLLAPLLLLPLAGAALNGAVGRFLPKSLSAAIGLVPIAASFVLALVAALQLHGLGGAEAYGAAALTQDIGEWLNVGPLVASWALHFDAVTAVMSLVITGVGFLIHLYSVGYMHDDEGFAKYFAYLNLFVAAMLSLVLADNLILLFLGWEGVGLVSWLLIGFWYKDAEKVDAANKAFIANRVGDLALMLGVFLLFGLAGTVHIGEMRDWVAHLSPAQITAAGTLLTTSTMLLFIGCTGKSAQIPLYVWLPDAMAGPTPVSALIHAATMVTAGIYLMVRLNFLFVLTPVTLGVVAVVGLATAIMAGTIGLMQNDIKKVLAYSTISQLGFMFLAAGVAAPAAAMFHLVTHAFFKALLFLGSGSVIHALSGEQDIRRMGGLGKVLPSTSKTFLIGCLAIAGFPLTSGFFSKDEILWSILNNQQVLGSPALSAVLFPLALFAAFLTALYMFRLYFVVFAGEQRLTDEAKSHLHESPAVMTGPLWGLAILSLVAGFAGLPHFTGLPNLFHHFIAPVIAPTEALVRSVYSHDSGAIWGCVGAGTVAGLSGMGLAFVLWGRGGETPAKLAASWPRLHALVLNKYYIDELYDFTFGKAMRIKSRVYDLFVDNLVIDTVAVGGAGWLSTFSGQLIGRLQNGNLQRYLTIAFIGLAIVLFLIARGGVTP